MGRSWRRRARRILREDALKQIYSARQDGWPITSAELGGRLGLTREGALRLARDLESAGLSRSHAGVLELTERGERCGLHLLRGHRLWERYLSDEAHLPLDVLHAEAERAEHQLGDDDLELLADHLGHPRTDPHGDPIPTAAGEFPSQERVPLTDWPRGQLAVVVHVEDEPAQPLKEALHAGLQPGTVLRVLKRDANAVVCETAAGQSKFAPAVAAQIDVRSAAEGEDLRKPFSTLARLPLGAEAEVVALSEHCTGLRRRRLLDLGFTAGAKVKAQLANFGNEAHAYHIRDTLIALREDEAEQVLIRPQKPRRADQRAEAQAKP
jgi:DtxR family Mn-dependent transcriptional regulator